MKTQPSVLVLGVILSLTIQPVGAESKLAPFAGSTFFEEFSPQPQLMVGDWCTATSQIVECSAFGMFDPNSKRLAINPDTTKMKLTTIDGDCQIVGISVGYEGECRVAIMPEVIQPCEKGCTGLSAVKDQVSLCTQLLELNCPKDAQFVLDSRGDFSGKVELDTIVSPGTCEDPKLAKTHNDNIAEAIRKAFWTASLKDCKTWFKKASEEAKLTCQPFRAEYDQCHRADD